VKEKQVDGPLRHSFGPLIFQASNAVSSHSCCRGPFMDFWHPPKKWQATWE